MTTTDQTMQSIARALLMVMRSSWHMSQTTQLNIEDDVFYYDSDLSERLEEVVRDYGHETDEEYIIYVDDLDYEWIEYAIDEILEDIED
jgi:hypothetical protein